MQPEHNWAGNYTYRAARMHRPETLDELRRLVAESRKVKALGTRHSFNAIADTEGDLVSMAAFREIRVDPDARTATVGGGVRYGDLCGPLAEHGLALPNLASLPHISIAGACATGTHGSGDRNGALPASVCGMEMVTADGGLIRLDRNDGALEGAVVGLGALGIVTELTLELAPEYTVRQDVFENLPLAEVEQAFEEIVSSAYSVSLFTDWQTEGFSQVWRKSRVGDAPPSLAEAAFYSATPAAGPLHPIARLSAESCTPQMGEEGPWHARIPHFRMEFTPSAGEELQSEYFVPRARALDAIRALFGLREALAPLLMISEVRTIAGDSLWLSPCFGRESVAFHFTWEPDEPAVRALLRRLEAALAPFEARPHWGKLFTMPAEVLERLYPRMADFRALRGRYDPEGKFLNDYLAGRLGEARGVMREA